MTDDRGSYFVEYFQVGQHLKVSAVDPVTLTEVSVVGTTRMSRDALSKLAVRKLEYVMEKRGLIRRKPGHSNS